MGPPMYLSDHFKFLQMMKLTKLTLNTFKTTKLFFSLVLALHLSPLLRTVRAEIRNVVEYQKRQNTKSNYE